MLACIEKLVAAWKQSGFTRAASQCHEGYLQGGKRGKEKNAEWCGVTGKTGSA